MNLPIYYDVDITQPLVPVPLQPMLVSKDALANRIGVRLYQGKTPYSPGGTCAGFVTRRDGTVPITGVISGNEMYIDLPAAAYDLEGPINIGIKNVQGNAVATVFLGMGTVVRGESDIVIDPGSVITISVAQLIAEIEEARASIPMDYSALSAAVTALQALDLSEKTNLSAITGNLITYGTVAVDKQLNQNNGTVVGAQGYNTTDFIPVSPGETLYGINGLRYCYYNSSKTYPSESDRTGNMSSAAELITGSGIRKITVPSWAAYIRICFNTTDYENSYLMRPSGFDRYLHEIVEGVPAMAQQVQELTSEVSGIFPAKLAGAEALIDGKYIRYQYGSTYTNSDTSYTGYIDVSQCENITYTRLVVPGSTVPDNGIAFYKANKEFIEESGIPSGTGATDRFGVMYTVAVPEDAVYARFSYWASTNTEKRTSSPAFAVYDTAVYTESMLSIMGRMDDLEGDINALSFWLQTLAGDVSSLIPARIASAADLINGKYVRHDSGGLTTNPDTSYTDFIDVSDYDSITYTRLAVPGSTTPKNGIAFYDSEKHFLSESGVPSAKGASARTGVIHSVPVPETAVYVRLSYWATTAAAYENSPDFAVYDTEVYNASIIARVGKLDEIDPLKARVDEVSQDGNLWAYGSVADNTKIASSGATSGDSGYKTTDFISVSPGDVIFGYGARFCVFNAEKSSVVDTGVLNNLSTEMPSGHYYVIPENGAFFRICNPKETAAFPFQLYKATLYDLYLKSLITNPAASGQKLYTLGDSITRGMYAEYGASASSGPTPYSYPYWIGQYTGYTVINLGNSGSGWANVGSPETQDDPSTAYNAKNVVDNNSFADADIITMAWGVNDWKGATQNVALGSMASTAGDGTVIGNMKYCIEKLMEKKPTAQLIVLLPLNTNRQWSGMDTMTLANNWAFGYAYRNNQTLQDYRNAIRECAEYYNIKVIDLEEICAMNRLNIRYMCGDGLHPTKAFHKQMGQALAPLIR